MNMIRAQYEQRGPVPQDVIDPVEMPIPDLKPGQVLVEVLAAPINPSDVLTLTGEYGMLPPLPAIGGAEGVGRVAKVADDVTTLPVGQTVLLPVSSGTWSTHLVLPAAKLIPLPNEADAQQLSMLTVNPPTASLMLTEFVKLELGEWVIQNVANSGVGSYLIQLANIRGWKTVNIVRRESAVEGVKALGGDVVLVDGPGLAKRVKEAIESYGDATSQSPGDSGWTPQAVPQGLDGRPKRASSNIRLAIDAVGGSATDRLASCLANGGTLVNYGMMGGEPCQVSPKNFVFNDVTLKGFWLAKWFKLASREQQMALYGELTKLIAMGKLHARVAETFDVKDIKAAVAAAVAGERDGKILVVPKR
jgi:mitochondrial enoyl-[acyl-carrier protein] reductase / trans-2-enoyl-CoA reductase